MRVLVDMNLSPTWVPFLRKSGVEAVHWSEVGAPSAADAELLRWARANDCVIFTHDLDFGALLAATRGLGPSVVQVRALDTLPETIGPDIVRVLHMRKAQLERGALVTVDRAHARVRVLPLQ